MQPYREMYHRCLYAFLVVLCFARCNPRGASLSYTSDIRHALHQANDKTLDLPQRLTAALHADSLSRITLNPALHIECLRISASIYLRMDSIVPAQKGFEELLSLLPADTIRAVALNNLGAIFKDRSEYDSALACYTKARDIFLLRKDTLRLAQCLINTGIVYKEQSAFDEAFRQTLSGVQLLQAIGAEKDLATAYTTLGNILKELNRYTEGLEYHTKALDIKTAEKDSSGMAACLNNMGNIYRHQRNYRKALEFYLQSYEIKKGWGTKNVLATTLDNIAETDAALGDNSAAKVYFNRAMQLYIGSGNLNGELTTANHLSRLYLSTGEGDKAKELALFAANHLPATGEWQLRLEHNLVWQQILAYEGNYRAADSFARKALDLKDSLFNLDMAQTVSQLNTRFHAGERIRELKNAREVQRQSSIRIRVQQYFIFSLGLFLLTLAVIVHLLRRSNNKKKEANKRVSMLMAELDHRVKNNLQLISDMLYLQEEEGTEDVPLLQGIRTRIQSMNIIQHFLYREEYDGTIPAKMFLEPLLDNIRQVNSKDGGTTTMMTTEDIALPVNTAITLGLIINELVTNFYKHNEAQHATMHISFFKDGQQHILHLTDNGSPWDKDKQTETRKGFGLTLVELLTEQLQGKWQVGQDNGRTVQIITFK